VGARLGPTDITGRLLQAAPLWAGRGAGMPGWGAGSDVRRVSGMAALPLPFSPPSGRPPNTVRV
jgi:hypothetical protein